MSERTPMGEAAGWVLRLQETSASAETFLEWQRWLAAAPEHRIAFDQIEETLLRLDDMNVKPNLPSMVEMAADTYDGSMPVGEFLAKRRPPRRETARPFPAEIQSSPQRRMSLVEKWARTTRIESRFSYAMVAGLAAVVLVGGWLQFDALRNSRHGVFAYSTAPGERKAFTLPDGSRITLDADSALNIKLTPDQRSLRLARGEAYFQVAKDPSRPFIVSAGGARVRAVGTQFNVRMGDHRTVVAVVEGLVQVAAPSELAKDPPQLVAQVAAGQAVAYVADGGLQTLPAAEASLATTWLNGRRQYRNEPLQYVLADVDRYTGRRIEVADAATGALKFTGTLSLENSDAWLKALSIALPVTVTQQSDGALLVTIEATNLRTVQPESPTAPISSIERRSKGFAEKLTQHVRSEGYLYN